MEYIDELLTSKSSYLQFRNYAIYTKYREDLDWKLHCHLNKLEDAVRVFEYIYFHFRRQQLKIVDCKRSSIIYE